jgi:hypothetical protein
MFNVSGSESHATNTISRLLMSAINPLTYNAE